MVGSLATVLSLGWIATDRFRGAIVAHPWAPDLVVDVSWRIETVTLAMGILVAAIGGLVAHYSAVYFGDSRDSRSLVALLALFQSSMLGLVLADNMYLLFVFWEITGIASFFLIGWDRRNPGGFEAARRALLVTSAGALPMLVGIIYLAAITGSASLTTWLALDLSPAVQTIALALILPAVMTKSAQVPFHFWLPGAMAAPTPVSAYLHSATMVKAGVLLLLYLYPVLSGSPLWTAVLVPFGAVTCVWGSYRALGESDIKLLMAWSTVSQLGLLTLTIGLGTDLAVRAAVLHLFAHAVFKAGLFLTVGGVDKAARTRLLPELGGLGRRAPVLFLVATVLSASMAGVPPLAGFLSKELILKKAMLTELWVHGLAIAGIVLGSIGTVAYSSRFVIEVFLGKKRGGVASPGVRPGAALLTAPVLLSVITIAAGPGAAWVDRWFLEPVAASLIGGALPAVVPLSLWYGVNAALILSLVIVVAGVVSDRIAGLRMTPRGPDTLSGERLFDGMLNVSRRVGGGLSRALSGGHPAVYLGLALLSGLAAGVQFIDLPDGFEVADVPISGLVTVSLLGVVLGALLVARGRLARVLLLSVAGFAVAFLFKLLNAPDLMLTQLLVEVLVTIFFALSLRRIASPGSSGRSQWARWISRGVALMTGILAGAMVLALGVTDTPGHVRAFYGEAAPALAKGLNVVNVILTDFRALDTLMETLVVLLAALGVAGLVRRAEMPDDSGSGEANEVWSIAVRKGLLPGMSKLIIPLALVFAVSLLVEGHDDPGGGFVAGLGSSIAAILVLTVAVRVTDRCWARRTALGGAVVLLTSLLGGLALAGSALSHAHGELLMFSTSWKWHTALFFDLGVVLVVAGGLASATRSLWPSPREQEVSS